MAIRKIYGECETKKKDYFTKGKKYEKKNIYL